MDFTLALDGIQQHNSKFSCFMLEEQNKKEFKLRLHEKSHIHLTCSNKFWLNKDVILGPTEPHKAHSSG